MEVTVYAGKWEHYGIQALQPVQGPSVWYAADMQCSTEWLHVLNQDDQQELLAAVEHAEKQQLHIQARLSIDCEQRGLTTAIRASICFQADQQQAAVLKACT